MAPNDFASPASGQHDDAYLIPPANPFSSVYPHGSGMFPRLAPRKFPDEEDAAPEPGPAMEQLPRPRPPRTPPPPPATAGGGPGAAAWPAPPAALPPPAAPAPAGAGRPAPNGAGNLMPAP